MITETTLLTEEHRNNLLNFSILTRKTFIDALVKETLVEEKLLINKDTSSFLTKLLDGMDKTIINIDKRNNERSSNKTKEETNALIANVLLNISKKNMRALLFLFTYILIIYFSEFIDLWIRINIHY